MFVRETEPVALTQEGLLSLCSSLNRPVVHIEQLPVGPARAAIALHRGPSGECCLVVAVRSIECGVVSAYTFRGAASNSIHQAMDLGLSFAEGMGFLFDDDMIQGEGQNGGLAAIDDAAGTQRARGAEHAHAFWCELVGEPSPPAAESAGNVAVNVEPEPTEDGSAGVALSKFRTPPGASPEPPTESQPDLAPPENPPQSPESSQAQLGRISIVRKRVSEQPEAGADFETRLRASF